MRAAQFVLSLFLFFTSCNAQEANENIILINVENSGRSEIADLVNRLNQLKPKVIAIDLQFASDHVDEIDNKLINALDKCNNLVMVSIIADYSPQNINHQRFIPGCLPKFTTNARTGFANLLPENEDDRILRRFALYEYVDGIKEYSFAWRTAHQFDSIKATRYLDQHSAYNKVDFTNGLTNFRRFTLTNVLEGKIDPKDFEQKIVLIGFLGLGEKDRFIAPLSTHSTAKEPNIYGLEFHAQVIAQILQ